MNNARRKEITKALNDLSALAGQLEDVKSALESARDDEQEYRDNMPESLQQSEKAENADAAIQALDAIIDPLNDLDVESLIGDVEGCL